MCPPPPLQHLHQHPRILNRIPLPIIIEIRPHPLGPALPNPLRPDRELLLRIIMPIPTLGPMKPDVNLIRRLHQFIRQPRPAARTEDDPPLPKRRQPPPPPPASMPKLPPLPPLRLKLAHDRAQPR